MSDFATIYSTLSQVDLSKLTEKKMGLTYLSWANAWDVMMAHYPAATFQTLPSETFSDGTVEVWVEVTVCDYSRRMWLPVMDNRNNAIPNPSSRAVSDARMRCLVKCLSLFGLGLYIYQGEDLPRKEEPSNLYTEKQLRDFRACLDHDDGMALALFVRDTDNEVLTALYNSFPPNKISSSKAKVQEMMSSAHKVVDEYMMGIREAVENNDLTALIEYKYELDTTTKKLLKDKLNENELKALRSVKVE